MNYDLPRPSMVALISQCLLILACAICLYLFLNAMQTKKSYAAAIIALNQQQQSLIEAARQLDTYRQFVAADSFYQCTTEEPQWEKMAETWVDLPYDQLLKRLSNLYRVDRPFVVDFFSAGVKDAPIDTAAQATPIGNRGGGDSTAQNGRLVFNLQGYFLCPCK